MIISNKISSFIGNNLTQSYIYIKTILNLFWFYNGIVAKFNNNLRKNIILFKFNYFKEKTYYNSWREGYHIHQVKISDFNTKILFKNIC